MARYFWSEDGIPETVTVKEVTLHTPARCCHCDAEIPAGTKVLQLTTTDGDIYLIHPACAKDSVDM